MISSTSLHPLKRAKLYTLDENWLEFKPMRIEVNPEKVGVVVNVAEARKFNDYDDEPTWVKIHSRVYQLFLSPDFPIGTIGIPHNEYYHVNSQSRIGVQIFFKGFDTRPLLREIHFRLRFIPFDKSVEHPLVLRLSSIVSRTNPFLRRQYFCRHQRIGIPFEEGILEFHAEKINFDSERFGVLNLQNYGFTDYSTKMDFFSDQPEKLRIIRSFSNYSCATFSIKLQNASMHSFAAAGRPALLHTTDIAHQLRDFYLGQHLYTSQKLAVLCPPFGMLNLRVESIKADNFPSIDEYSVLLSKFSDISLTTDNPELHIVSGEGEIANAVVLKIESATIMDDDLGTKPPKWIVTQNLTKWMRSKPIGFIANQEYGIPIDQAGSVFVKFTEIHGDTPLEAGAFWKLGAFTDVKYTIKKELGIPLVDTSEAYPIRDIHFKVSAPEWIRSATIDYPVIEKALNDLKMDVFAEGQIIKLTIPGKMYTFIVEVSSLRFDPKKVSLNEVRYGILGKLVPETRKHIDSGNTNLAIIKKSMDEIFADPNKYLTELGLGGISDECVDYLKSLLLANNMLKDDLAELHIEPSRGLLLYGPSGTGKTTFLKIIASFLGIPDSRVKRIDAPCLLDKWRGETERKIHDLFEDAKTASKLLGPSAPIYLIVIDEIDALTSTRTGHSSHDTVVGSLLTALDGLNTAPNIFVIGTTNRIEHIDDAILRFGRLHPQIKLDLPNEKGREQIFDIHLKVHRENGIVDEDVSSKHLAKLTEGMSGATIKSIISQAINKTLPHAYKTNDQGVRCFDRSLLRITRKALMQLITNTKMNSVQELPYPHMYK